MFRRKPLAMAVQAATAGIASLASVPALSQEGALVEEIVVTGSRIQRANLVTSSPVTQLDSEQLSFTGVTRVEDVLGSMPQVYLDQSSGQSIESEGTATLQLRNLGNSRTLVLVNGKRLPIHSPQSDTSGPDLNFIPMQLVERVEILTGGASSTYGSDAIAGVVNFIMMDDFEGVKLDVQTAQYRHDNDGNRAADSTLAAGFDVPTGTSTDGDIQDMTLILGGNLQDGRGNVTAYASYREVDPVTQGDRDYSACANSVTADGTLSCGGSATNPTGSFYFDTDGFDQIYTVQGDQFVPELGRLHNFAVPSYYQRPDERYTFGAFAHYELTEQVEVYSELMFMDDRTVAQFAESGIFFNTLDFNCGNPLLSDQQRATVGCTGDPDQMITTIFGRRNVEGGPRQGDQRHTSFRILAGMRGDLNETWRYDASYQYAEVDMSNRHSNYVNVAAVDRALDVNPDGTCMEDSENCVPWNLWENGGVTADQTEYFAQTYNENGTTDQEVFSMYVQGSLGDYDVRSPWAESGVEVVLGYEYRKEGLGYFPSDNAQAGEVGGLGAALVSVEGSYKVNEFYVEASIPVIEGATLAEEVVLDLGYRYSDYDPYDETTDTYKIAGTWALNTDIKFRGSYQRAVRAPNIVDAFQPQQGTLFAMNEDPCDRRGSTNPNLSLRGYTFEECARSGVSQAIWDNGGPASSPASQYNTLIGGSVELEPEKSDTYSVGVVLTPGFLEGLTVSVDYYDIDVEDAIESIESETTLLQCIETGQFCDLVRRGTNDSLWLGLASATNGISALSQNIGFFRVKGIDLEVTYGFEMGGLGTMSINNVLGWIDSWEQEEYDGAGIVNCEGIYGGSCEAPTVELRNRMQAIWSSPWNVDVSLGWRYIGGVDQAFTNLPPTKLDAMNYIDLSAAWQATEWLNIRGGVNNLFDEEPPFVPQGVTARENGNTYPGAYDALGQYLFLGATVQF